jgi:hypothetical protein
MRLQHLQAHLCGSPRARHRSISQAPSSQLAAGKKLAHTDTSGTGMLTQGGQQGGRPVPLASRFHRTPAHFLLKMHGI